ncbi:MAG: diaminopimelate epimerase [Methanobacteriota archaeon]|nr:MAG: diaminopimelate epimerase [Euryarchaeota archaeon]
MTRRMDFVKYQGCGNDFIIVDEMEGDTTPDDDRSKLAKSLCDRRFGIGADGLIFIEPTRDADCSMRLFEPAGNEADMCGNGLRCVASFISDRIPEPDRNVTILTADGIKEVRKEDSEFTADMGEVRSTRSYLEDYVSDPGSPDDSMLDFEVDFCGCRHQGSLLNTGEPHIVIFTEDVSSIDLVRAGTQVNSNRNRFPAGVNLNFVQTMGACDISVRTYERGVYDETYACGTGATACAAAAVLKGVVTDTRVIVTTRGGILTIELLPDGRALMTGPAKRVFSGNVNLD